MIEIHVVSRKILTSQQNFWIRKFPGSARRIYASSAVPTMILMTTQVPAKHSGPIWNEFDRFYSTSNSGVGFCTAVWNWRKISTHTTNKLTSAPFSLFFLQVGDEKLCLDIDIMFLGKFLGSQTKRIDETAEKASWIIFDFLKQNWCFRIQTWIFGYDSVLTWSFRI